MSNREKPPTGTLEHGKPTPLVKQAAGIRRQTADPPFQKPVAGSSQLAAGEKQEAKTKNTDKRRRKKDLGPTAVFMEKPIAAYLADRVLSQEHKERCRAVLWRLGAFLRERGVITLRAVEKAHVDAYGATLEGLAPATQALRLRIVKCFFDWLHGSEKILGHPAAHLRIPHPQAPLPEPLTQREVERLLAAPDPDTVLGLRDRAMLETLYATGMRIGELLALKLQHVDLAERLAFIEKGKGGKCRWVPLTRDAADYLSAYLELARPRLVKGRATAYLFISGQGRALCKAQMETNCRRYAQQARIERRVWPHLLRHTAACHLLENGASLFHVQLFLGHARAESTQGYTRITLGHLKETMQRCHPRS